jgi:hypothetical protein
MKKACVCFVIGLISFGWSFQTASALPPFNKEWLAKYKEASSNAKFVEAIETAKCNVCHEGTNKKMKNEYGKVIGKYLTKAKYNEIKEDDDAAKKYILEGFAKAEAEKNGSGKSFGEMLKAGDLPGGPAGGAH